MGLHDGRLKLALAAPPVDGKANKALVAFVASSMGVSRPEVQVVSGDAARRKRVFVSNLSRVSALAALAG